MLPMIPGNQMSAKTIPELKNNTWIQYTFFFFHLKYSGNLS